MRQRLCRSLAAVAALLLCATTGAQAGSPRTVELESGAQLVYRPAGESGQPYVPVVLLPYTGGSAQDLYRWKYRRFLQQYDSPDIALILPEAEGRYSDYRSGERWARTVSDWERRLQAILDEASARLPLDRERIVLAGHSMGGDLAWALMQRRPDRYAGAVIMGSRCTWRSTGSPQKLAERQVRVAFSVGENEREARRNGALLASRLLEQVGVRVRWDDMPGGHHPASGPLFARQLDFVLDRYPVTASAE